MFPENSGENSGGAKNLIPHRFQPGQSGNPGGRPRKQPITDYLRSQLETAIPSEMLSRMKSEYREDFSAVYGDRPTFGQMIAFQLISQAARGDAAVLSLLLDRVEGKANQKNVREENNEVVFRVVHVK